MRTKWSKTWVSSKQPRKQRKYRYNAPLHIRHRFLGAHLSHELIKRYKKRSMPVRKGDEVQIMRGQFKKQKGVVDRIDLKKSKVYLDGIKVKKADGSEVMKALEPSNLRIISLNLDDKKRLAVLNRSGKGKAEVKKVEKPAVKKVEKPAAKKEKVVEKKIKPKVVEKPEKKEAKKPEKVKKPAKKKEIKPTKKPAKPKTKKEKK